MNKFGLVVASLVLSVSTFAQGVINVNTRFGSPASTRYIDLPTEVRTAENSFNGHITSSSFVAQFVVNGTAIGAPLNFRGGTTGNFGALNPTSGGGSAERALPVAGPGNVNVEIRVWDSAVFTSWDAASAALAAGRHTVATAAGSNTFAYSIPDPNVANAPSAFNIANFQGFTLTYIPAVPEPTTIALGALGAAALLWRRRK